MESFMVIVVGGVMGSVEVRWAGGWMRRMDEEVDWRIDEEDG